MNQDHIFIGKKNSLFVYLIWFP